MFEQWVGSVAVYDDELLFQRPLITVDYRSLGETRDSGKLKWLRLERMARYRTGFLVQYQSVEIGRIRHQSRMNRYVKLL